MPRSYLGALIALLELIRFLLQLLN
ncbi:Damage inducible protein [Escherichia coli]|nr:Damage inducible protein [Escherichia coli]